MKALIKVFTTIIVITGICGCSGKYLLSPFPSTYRESIHRELIKYPDPVKTLSIQAAQESEQECKVIRDQKLQKRLEKIMNNLLDETDKTPKGLTINAVDCKGLNAYSFPAARKIYIMKDLINISDSEDELAFVVAHEISHHYERSGTPAAIRQEVDNTVRDIIVRGVVNCELAKKMQGKVAWRVDHQECMRNVKYQAIAIAKAERRKIETRTDEYALDLHHAAGYRHSAAKSILTKISGKDELEDISSSNWYAISLMTHPRAKERLEDLDNWGSHSYGVWDTFIP